MAVATTGCPVLVSAAAGSGKTTVLAERCAYLICDAPPADRCDIDRLLVLTFTEAAATEMRTRIVETIRRRLEDSPNDSRLRDQLILAESAQISTIHGFCLWMIRRWFEEAGVDPLSSVLDAEEAVVVREQVLDELFEEQYQIGRTDGPSLGEDALSDDAQGLNGFLSLIEIYGLGDDSGIRRFVQRLYAFATSLPDPDEWLNGAISILTSDSTRALDELARTLNAELRMQITHAEALAGKIAAGPPCGHDYGAMIRSYADALSQWAQRLADAGSSAAGLDAVREAIVTFSFDRARQARNLSEAEKAAREQARKLRDETKRLFEDRLKEQFGMFSSQEWAEGLTKTEPFVRTLVDLVQRFTARYSVRKRRLNVMDFADFERLAYGLVREAGSPVAMALREKFQHVLVDEFQDINPLQAALLRAVSREDAAAGSGNLFVVGDVKQSIYRFRLAEPEIFLDRLESMRKNHPSNGRALSLQSNFRSRQEILDAVNGVFRCLMTGELGGLTYDHEAELRPGKPAGDEAHVPVELHIFERRFGPAEAEIQNEDGNDDDGASEEGVGGDSEPAGAPNPGEPPSRWDPIVREAYWISREIRRLMDEGETWDGRPLKYSDIAILLRSTKINADRVAGVLGQMGIPAYAQVGGSLMGSLEVREVVAALEVLDNLQQDIPLTGVLRSGIFGDRFTPDELVEIRLLDRHCPYHEAVRKYASSGPDSALRARLDAVLRRIGRYRTDAVRRPLSQTVWNLLQGQGYLAYVMGLPCGAQRKANLLKLHEISRRFGSHRQQGLHRFLRLLGSLAEDDQSIALASTSGAGENVVRIMTIHQAKGTEYPVVFLAGLGTKFNLGDRSGRMIFERKSRIGLRAVDRERMIEYPTAVHQLVATEVEKSTREEELRILYVAMTRSKKRLILLGSMEGVGRPGATLGGDMTPLRVATARTPLDWLLPAIGAADQARLPIDITAHDAEEIAGWSMAPPVQAEERALLRAVGSWAELPNNEPVASENPEIDTVVRQLESSYRHLGATSVKATVPASEYERATQSVINRAAAAVYSTRPQRIDTYDSAKGIDAKQRGTITHRILQHLNFDRACNASGTEAELARLVSEGIITKDELEAVSQADLAWLVETPVADRIRRAGAQYHRELRFITSEPLSASDETILDHEGDRVLIRGMIDGVLEGPEGLTIIDFKTDVVQPTEVEAKAERYRPQLEIYSHSAERLWGRPVSAGVLVFLAARRIVEVPLKSNGFEK